MYKLTKEKQSADLQMLLIFGRRNGMHDIPSAAAALIHNKSIRIIVYIGVKLKSTKLRFRLQVIYVKFY